VSEELPIWLGEYDTIGIADLNQDGSPEIFVGATVVDADGLFLWHGSAGQGAGPRGRTAVAADIDPSRPGLELLAGHTLYTADGSIVWDSPGIPDGYTAVADFTGDGRPEIVLVSARQIHMLDAAGRNLGTHMLAANSPPPLVADLDGDGTPELFTSDGRTAKVLEWNGFSFTQRWSRVVRDPTSLAGAVAYDFDGDGAAEVIYRDEHEWFIFDGATGGTLWRETFGSATLLETPVVADIDGDCVTEIIVTGCARNSRTDRVVAYECPSAVPARSIWNQLLYHVTNVEDDGTIPRKEVAPWTAGNTAMAQAGAGGQAVADAGPAITACVGERVTLDASGSLPCDASGLEYRWLLAGDVICDWSDQPTCEVQPDVTTTYDLEVQCVAFGCSAGASASVEVTVIPEPVAMLSGPPVLCEGESLTLDSSASTGSCPDPLQYRFSRGTTTIRDWDNADRHGPFAVSTSAPYRVDVRCPTVTGCSQSATINVGVVPYPQIAIAAPDQICLGESFDLDASGSDPMGCPTPLEYRFLDGARVLRDWAVSDRVSGLSPPATTSYTVEARCLPATCTSAQIHTVDVVPPPLAAAGTDARLCALASLTLDASGSTDAGCPGGLEYEWREGTTVVRAAGSSPTWTPPTSVPGLFNYSAVVRCALAPACEDSDDVVVTVDACSLAVEFDDWDALRVGDRVEVTWKTIDEDGTLGFVVERAPAMTGPFRAIGNTEARGAGASYRLTDDAAPGASSWYRVVEMTMAGPGDQTPPFAPREVTSGGRRRVSRDRRER